MSRGDAAASHREPGAQPDRARLRARPRRAPGRAHRVLRPSERSASARVAKVGGTKDVNLARLRRLAPTHVLVNVDENRQETIEAIEAWGDDAPKIVVTHPRDPVDNLALVDQLAAVFAGAPRRRRPRRRACAPPSPTSSRRRAPRAGRRRRVLYLIWHDPWMTVARDTYLSRMLARIGWQTLPDADGGYAGAGALPDVDRRRALARHGRAGAAQLRAVRLPGPSHAPKRRRSARRRRCCASTASCSAGTARARSPGCATCGALADDDNAAPRSPA